MSIPNTRNKAKMHGIIAVILSALFALVWFLTDRTTATYRESQRVTYMPTSTSLPGWIQVLWVTTVVLGALALVFLGFWVKETVMQLRNNRRHGLPHVSNTIFASLACVSGLFVIALAAALFALSLVALLLVLTSNAAYTVIAVIVSVAFGLLFSLALVSWIRHHISVRRANKAIVAKAAEDTDRVRLY